MDFGLSPQHEIFRRTVAEVVDKEVPPRVPEMEESGEWPTDLFRRMGELSWQMYPLASKADILGLTRTLALEFSRYGINVNCVVPGATETPMTASIPADLVQRLSEKISLKWFADAEEIANVHLFLVGEDASYITGQCLIVDGGNTLGA